MIENKIMTMESAILLMKHIGHWNDLKGNFVQTFDYSSLNKRVQEMIVEEDKKKEEKDEKLLVDLCECYLLFNSFASSEMISICMPCLLKVALKKEENMETQKDVEMALLAFGTIWYCKTEEDQYLDEIKEIIQYHKEHRNLTQLSYQSAWELLINQIWLETLDSFFDSCKLWNEECAELVSRIERMFWVARENDRIISNKCICAFGSAALNRTVEIGDLLIEGVVGAVLEGVLQSNDEYSRIDVCLLFFENVADRLKDKEEKESEEAKRKEMKRKVFEKMEEEGYEDWVMGLSFCIAKGSRDIFLIERYSDHFIYL
eukprot:MONOS_11668.1-p1 / transcript=MONOS_11668.1 / gene=MONOS_11668 / organism=Monocercomonoides_exilis_PA203 / gene_product=unspecified product / transcript_product=unspecified product / location=Mono_scaffold00599:22165-23325(+) / protein_length=317 / sequence_SO=supercontig / SO=protein_coding / is_pseudo=false